LVVIASVVDPDPVGSASLWRIRICIHFNQMQSKTICSSRKFQCTVLK
jgi:hypothetical protein